MPDKRIDLAGSGELQLVTPLILSQAREFNYELLEEAEICGPHYAYYNMRWQSHFKAIVFGAVEIQERQNASVQVSFHYHPFEGVNRPVETLTETPEYLHFDDYVTQTSALLVEIGLQLVPAAATDGAAPRQSR